MPSALIAQPCGTAIPLDYARMTTKLHAATSAASATEAIEAVRGTSLRIPGTAIRVDGSHQGERTVSAIKAGIVRDVVGLDRGTAKIERDRVADRETRKSLDTRRLRAGTIAENGIRNVMAMNRIGESAEGTGAGTDTVHGGVSLHFFLQPRSYLAGD